MESINALPVCDLEQCSGCALCVSRCPGLACFVIDETVGNGKVKIVLPHEMLPLPKENDTADALGRDGGVVGEALVMKVRGGKALDHTNVVSVLVDEELMYDVRCIRAR